MIGLSHNAADEAIVAAQLGRDPRGTWGVARRCHLGIPMVIESHPRLEDGSPFPTLFWLTCPLLIKRVSGLESEGWMTLLNDKLARDDGLRERLVEAIREYETRRDRHEVIPVSSPAGGGPDKVKCVHAHTAHELVSSNPVGALALTEIGWPDCAAPCREIR